MRFHMDNDRPIVTTAWVLVEVLDAMSSPRHRSRAVAFVRDLVGTGRVDIEGSEVHFDAGLSLFEKRPDKEWSLTDCISFAVMKRRRLSDALTGDHHFMQAGFKALMR